MRGFVRVVDNISTAFGKVSLYLLLVMWVLMTVGVVARYGFGMPLKWVPESTLFLFGVSFMLAGAITLQCGEHVRVEILVNRISSPKMRRVLDLVTSLAFWLFGFMLLYWGVIGGQYSRVQDWLMPYLA